MHTEIFSPEEIGRYHLNAINRLIWEKLTLEQQDELYYHHIKVLDSLKR